MESKPPASALPIETTRFAVLIFTDIVGSTELKARHGVPVFSEALRIHNSHFERIARECLNTRTLQSRGDGYFAETGSVAEAVRFALLFEEAMRAETWGEVRVAVRIGIHAGEVGAFNEQDGTWIVGPAADLAARVTSLAVGGQILLTRFPFDEARHFIREHPVVAGKAMPPLRWLAHGPYLLKGRDEPMEIFEVGADGLAPLVPPPDSEKAKRAIRPGEEETLGWRPAIGLEIPGRTDWHLTEKLGAGGFGEVWTGEHAKFHQRHAFKFCFDDERLRALKREVTLVRLLRSALGERDDIVHIHELKLDAPPFYLESDLAPHGNLLQWAERQGGLDEIPLAQRIALVAHTANALAAAHSLGVLHKDIKPTNILIFDGPGAEPRPRLVDFGVGTLADPSVLSEHGVTASGFTRKVEHSTGTPTYSPPEYLAGKPYTIKGDVYGLGILLYQLATNKPNEPLAAGWERDIPDPLLREDIAACVDGDPARRLPRAADLADRLLGLETRRSELAEQERLARIAETHLQIHAAAAEAHTRTKRHRKITVGLTLLVLFCLTAGWLGFHFVEAHRPSSVEITSDPTSAEVWRDGHRVGITPFAEQHQTASHIAYALKSAGFYDSVCVATLVPGQNLTLQISLRPKDSTPASVASPANPGKGYFGQLVEKKSLVQVSHDGKFWTDAPVGTKIFQGDWIRTGPTSAATIEQQDSTSLRIGADTIFAPDGDGIELKDGSIRFQGQGPKHIKTQALTGEITG